MLTDLSECAKFQWHPNSNLINTINLNSQEILLTGSNGQISSQTCTRADLKRKDVPLKEVPRLKRSRACYLNNVSEIPMNSDISDGSVIASGSMDIADPDVGSTCIQIPTADEDFSSDGLDEFRGSSDDEDDMDAQQVQSQKADQFLSVRHYLGKMDIEEQGPRSGGRSAPDDVFALDG
ncbi:hypothetical protein MKW98_024856 [Papaver atlanticum]|uniref:Uncharacterized protein n=1 Tax=Papaver atlanticum TaxID=357466 RepID=A0AAD4XSS6_9MAGN|nr:hypothetical protein MKW98_024856 [Papaver atlanticum]